MVISPWPLEETYEYPISSKFPFWNLNLCSKFPRNKSNLTLSTPLLIDISPNSFPVLYPSLPVLLLLCLVECLYLSLLPLPLLYGWSYSWKVQFEYSRLGVIIWIELGRAVALLCKIISIRLGSLFSLFESNLFLFDSDKLIKSFQNMRNSGLPFHCLFYTL